MLRHTWPSSATTGEPSHRGIARAGRPGARPRSPGLGRGKGCPTSNRVGYRGRRALFELLPSSPEVRAALEEARSAPEIEQAGLTPGGSPVGEADVGFGRSKTVSRKDSDSLNRRSALETSPCS